MSRSESDGDMSSSDIDGDTDNLSDSDTEVDESDISGDPYCLLVQLILYHIQFFKINTPTLEPYTCADVFVCLHECLRKGPIGYWEKCEDDKFWTFWEVHATPTRQYPDDYAEIVQNFASSVTNFDRFKKIMKNMKKYFDRFNWELRDLFIPRTLRNPFIEWFRTQDTSLSQKYILTMIGQQKKAFIDIIKQFYFPYEEYMKTQDRVAFARQFHVATRARRKADNCPPPMNPKRQRVALLL